MKHSECDKLFKAGKSLLKASHLTRWKNQAFEARFPADDDCEFEKHCAKWDPRFGRYMAWVLFSVGAENLAKAACVCNEIVETPQPECLRYRRYTTDLSVPEWVQEVRDETRTAEGGRATRYDYRDLGKYWQCHLHQLCDKRHISREDTCHLIASYKYLTQAIRNRDAHTYIAHQRRGDFPAVARVFVPAFNILVTTMKKGDHFDAKGLKGTDA